jgi:hypothetical protein
MSDIQTEMQKVLRVWDATPPVTTLSHGFKPTNNVSRVTFDAVKNTPGCEPKYYVEQLVEEGYKKASVSSLLAQMIRQGLLRRDDQGGLRATVPEYTPLKAPSKRKVGTVKRAYAKRAEPTITEAIASMRSKNPPARVPSGSSVDSIMDDISLTDANELYRRLHKFFGAT